MMTTTKMKAPSGVSSMCVEGFAIPIDENGVATVDSRFAAALAGHGFTEIGAREVVDGRAAQIQSIVNNARVVAEAQTPEVLSTFSDLAPDDKLTFWDMFADALRRFPASVSAPKAAAPTESPKAAAPTESPKAAAPTESPKAAAPTEKK